MRILDYRAPLNPTKLDYSYPFASPFTTDKEPWQSNGHYFVIMTHEDRMKITEAQREKEPKASVSVLIEKMGSGKHCEYVGIGQIPSPGKPLDAIIYKAGSEFVGVRRQYADIVLSRYLDASPTLSDSGNFVAFFRGTDIVGIVTVEINDWDLFSLMEEITKS